MKKKKAKEGGISWKEAAAMAVVMTVVEMVPALNGLVNSVLIPVAVIAVIFLLARRLFRGGSGSGRRSRRESAPSRMGRSAGHGFYNGAMGWLNGKPKSQWEKDIEARDEARKKYAWHEQQAEKYKGTSDGAWHEQRMKELWNKMR